MSTETTLKPQPTKPLGTFIVLECRGGSDKGPDGHRKDTIPICNALINHNFEAYPLFYSDAEADEIYPKLTAAMGVIVRVNPGKYDGVTQSKLDETLIGVANRGISIMSHPDVMKKMGAKDALVKIKDLSCGMSDTYAYYDIESFKKSFPETIATGTRVLKQNRGSQGEGIWVCKVKEGQEGAVTGSTMLDLQEAVDNHKEEKTVEEFMTFCEQYIEGEDGQLIDQRFLPRIVEGELRVNMIYDTPTEIVHKKPAEGGISATLASGAKYVQYKPDDPQFAVLMNNFIKKDLPKIMPALEMEGQPIPLIWTADFILGEKDANGSDTYYVGEFNCSCVGITTQLHLAQPVADAALKIMTQKRLDQVTVPSAQPSNPKGRVAVIECRGGSDKGLDGHRKDTIPMCNALIKQGYEANAIFYTDAEQPAVQEKLKGYDGIIVRVNPGKYDGVTQSLLDKTIQDAASAGAAAMSHPDVMKKMGAKDALVKIRDLSCGMSDTYAYYDIESFKKSFPETIATGTRVLKQNRGSQGEGIWVCKVKEGQEGAVTGSTMLDLQEAVDNHKEEKTVEEFMTFCEQYIEGEDGQLIDQRFLPRIVEGELRVNMIYDTPTEIVHKKPAEGGISATLASGAKYVQYKPDDPQFSVLMDNFIKTDLPKIMPALGMEGQPIPLIWTADFILGDKDDQGRDTYFVGEFNCSCVGITTQLHLAEPVAKSAVQIIQTSKKTRADVLAPQPEKPIGSIVVLECRGGSDKGPDGHRRDTIPICNALIKHGYAAKPLFYSDAEQPQVLCELQQSQGVIVRVNPGKYDGVSQSLLEQTIKAAANSGVVPMSHPDVMRKMGAKDALVKIRDLSCGMSDTYAYYDIESFKQSFPETIATGTRVLKQNRGSQGEGIWVCKVKEGQSGPVTGSTMLDLQEAVDNHKEEKTVDEFMTFCEQYIEGEEGQLIDQRFLPRIVEGELRVNMIYDTPTEIVHKKPAEGGISATLASGAKYVQYKPDDPQFSVLMDNFIKADLPKIMPALGMEGQPIPLIWTADFILGDKDDKGRDTYFVGEFNCSCVGITTQLHLAQPVADAAITIVTATNDNVVKLANAPANPNGKMAVVECRGGSDKGPDGHRRDTIPMCNAMIQHGWKAFPIFYSDEEKDTVLETLKGCDGMVVRVNPGKYDGVTQSMLEETIMTAASSGVTAMSHPDVMRKMGAKDALVKIRDLSCGMPDTYAYYDIPSFKKKFPETIATGTRVLKQNRGSQGEGIWVCKVKEGQEGPVTGSTVLDLQEAVDNHKEEKTVDEFMTFCEQYIEGEEGQLIDQRFLPRIVEGELRVNMIYDTPTEIVHKKPAEGGISATLASGAKYVQYKPDDPQFSVLMDNFIKSDLPKIMPALGMEGQPIPLIWTADFILGDKDDKGRDTYFVGEFNCSCVGITTQLHLAQPVADAAIAISTANNPKVTKLSKQPANPVGRMAVIECRGGSDKGPDGHRRDTIPMCNAVIKHGWEAFPIFYSDAERQSVTNRLKGCSGVIVRVNPGKYDGVTQSTLDQTIKDAVTNGAAAMSHPDVMRKMGAKDALVKIRDLSCGMSDTYAYYDIESFKKSFPETIATGTRVLKQNRGSQGEGIWVCKVKEGQERPVTGSTVLDLQEAVDNHKEEMTVDEFMTFCEQYIEGEEGQLIDQRFLPRIVEGELRVNMIYDTPTEIVHKKPAEGGISATLASGAKYVQYKPDDPQFSVLMDNFIKSDLPKIMPALGMEGQPIPLIWTADFILGDKTPDGKDTYFVGEFNCSCVGITTQLHLAQPVADAAINISTAKNTKVVKLAEQPSTSGGRFAVLECRGGSDKGPDGHRRDTNPICNQLIGLGFEARPIFYSDAERDSVLAYLKTCAGIVVRVNPGKYEGVTQSLLDKTVKEAVDSGAVAMSHPDVMRKMGAKDALVKIRDLSCGMSDTYAYYDIPSFKQNFPTTIGTGTRVLKQNRGSQGEGIWVCKVKAGQSGPVTGSTVLDLQEAVDNHKEEMTVDQFMTFCEQYIEGEEGQLIDQRFLPRIVEGELRVNMIYDTPTEIVHKKPAEGGISATLASGAKYVSYQPDDPQFAVLMDNFIKSDLPKIMPALGMEGQPIPLIWTADFILGDKDAQGRDTYFVGEFNCSCVGITQQLHLATPVAVSAVRIATGKIVQPPSVSVTLQEGSAGQVSVTIADATPPIEYATPPVALNPQPAQPIGQMYVVECRGGSDKGVDGHRRDTIPICNALIDNGWACEPIFYSDAEHASVAATLQQAQGIIVRVNPGKYVGVTQSKLDALIKDAVDRGACAMSHPDVMRKMGAKDALVKIRDLSCGMPDTYAYYDIQSFKQNFPSTIGTGTRVLKQNRGSQGEGIWVCKVKAGQSGPVAGNTVLDLQEAVDNHKEEMTVDQFMTFCEQYIEGEEGQLIDQRFLPRIVEGELRVNMIYDTPTEIVHKKPAEGGISATLASGAKYVSYQPDDPQFAVLMNNFIKSDLPKIMPALDMQGQPIPLIWTADFILGDKTPDGKDTYFVGEFNCSCVGITQQLHLAQPVGNAAIAIVKDNMANPRPVVQRTQLAKATDANNALAPSEPLLPQPSMPSGRVFVVEVYGGSDKGSNGHRAETTPLCNAFIGQNWAAQPMFYADADYNLIQKTLSQADGVIVRVQPGDYPGVTTWKLQSVLSEAAACGVTVVQDMSVTNVQHLAASTINQIQQARNVQGSYLAQAQMAQISAKSVPKMPTPSAPASAGQLQPIEVSSRDFKSSDILALASFTEGTRKKNQVLHYLEDNRVAEILRKGLKRVYRAQPQNPVRFLANYFAEHDPEAYNGAPVIRDQAPATASHRYE